MSEAAIVTRALTKRFGEVRAVHDVHLRVETGSITGIIGPNGAGKSTTFLMLATLLEPSRGRATVCGFDPVSQPADVRAHVGYMPDFFGIYDDLTAAEYLEFFAASYGIAPDRRRTLIDDLLELVGLTGKREAFVNTLSRGMKQRLCLARALVHDPEILILDEPASGLDPGARIELRNLLRDLQGMGKTIMISSHILSELEDVCSHVAIMNGGTLVAQGEPSVMAAELQPLARYVITSSLRPFDLRLAIIDAGATPVLVRQDGGVVTDIEGGEEGAAALLRALVLADVPVTSFAEEPTGLEELFLRVTKGTE